MTPREIYVAMRRNNPDMAFHHPSIAGCVRGLYLRGELERRVADVPTQNGQTVYEYKKKERISHERSKKDYTPAAEKRMVYSTG